MAKQAAAMADDFTPSAGLPGVSFQLNQDPRARGRADSISVDPRRRASLGPRAATRSRGADVGGGAPEGYKARQSIGGEHDTGGGSILNTFNEFNKMLDEQFEKSVLVSPREYARLWGYLEADARLVAEFLSRLIDKLVKSQKLVKRGLWKPRKAGKENQDIAEVAGELYAGDLNAAMNDFHTGILSTIYHVALNYDFAIDTNKEDDKLRAAMVKWKRRIDRNPSVNNFFREACFFVEEKGSQGTSFQAVEFPLSDHLENIVHNDSIRGIARPFEMPPMLRELCVGPASTWLCLSDHFFSPVAWNPEGSPGMLADRVARGVEGLTDMLKVHNTEPRLLCIFQMLDALLHTAPFLPTAQVEKLLVALDRYYCWPCPFGPLAQQLVGLAERELACPGAGLRDRWLHEHPAAERFWQASARHLPAPEPAPVVASDSKAAKPPLLPPPPPPPPPPAIDSDDEVYSIPIYLDPAAMNATYFEMLITTKEAGAPEASTEERPAAEAAELLAHLLQCLGGGRLRIPADAAARLEHDPQLQAAYSRARQLEWAARTVGPAEIRLQRAARKPGRSGQLLVSTAAEVEAQRRDREDDIVELAAGLTSLGGWAVVAEHTEPEPEPQMGGIGGVGGVGGSSPWGGGLKTDNGLGTRLNRQPPKYVLFHAPASGFGASAQWPPPAMRQAAASLVEMVASGCGRRLDGDPAASWLWTDPMSKSQPPDAIWQLRLGVAGGAAALHSLVNAAALLDRLLLRRSRPAAAMGSRQPVVAEREANEAEAVQSLAEVAGSEQFWQAWAATRLQVYLLPIDGGPAADRPAPQPILRPDARAGADPAAAADPAGGQHGVLGYSAQGLAQYIGRVDSWYCRHVYSPLACRVPMTPHVLPPGSTRLKAEDAAGSADSSSPDINGLPSVAEESEDLELVSNCPALSSRALVTDYFRHGRNRFDVQVYQLRCWRKPLAASPAAGAASPAAPGSADHRIVLCDRLQLGPAALADWLEAQTGAHDSTQYPADPADVQKEVDLANRGVLAPTRLVYQPAGLDGQPVTSQPDQPMRSVFHRPPESDPPLHCGYFDGPARALAPPLPTEAGGEAAVTQAAMANVWAGGPPPAVLLGRVDCRNIGHAGQEPLGPTPDPAAAWFELRAEFAELPDLAALTKRKRRRPPTPLVSHLSAYAAGYHAADIVTGCCLLGLNAAAAVPSWRWSRGCTPSSRWPQTCQTTRITPRRTAGPSQRSLDST